MLSFFKRLFGDVAPPAAPVPDATAPTMIPTVAIVNVGSVVTDAEIAAAAAAIQVQVTRDFAPIWKTSAKIIPIAKGARVPADAWIIYVMDTSDQAGALGYHQLTPQGNPVGKIFAKDDLKYGLSWTVTLSHEILEMLADPYIQNTVFAQQTNTTGTLYALEVADACEDDSFGYRINGILVSDFVYPTWFEDWRTPNSAKFDHMNVIHAPLTLARGGYIGVFTVPTATGWTQITAEAAPPARLVAKGEYSRVKRRGKKPE